MSTPDEPRDSSPPARPSRREFAVAATGALAGMLVSQAASASGSREPKLSGRIAMAIDLRRCTGCRACAVACKAEHGVRLGGFRSWVSEQEFGTQPRMTREFLPRLCNHCEEPACEKVCPTGATFKRGDGIVTIDPERCIGCRHCMAACGYNARYFNSQIDPEDVQRRYPARTHGTVDKCDFCARRVDAGGKPSCVATCPAGARTFGDAEDPQSDVFAMLRSGNAVPLLPELGTRPSVFYAGGRPESFRRDLAG